MRICKDLIKKYNIGKSDLEQISNFLERYDYVFVDEKDYNSKFEEINHGVTSGVFLSEGKTKYLMSKENAIKFNLNYSELTENELVNVFLVNREYQGLPELAHIYIKNLVSNVDKYKTNLYTNWETGESVDVEVELKDDGIIKRLIRFDDDIIEETFLVFDKKYKLFDGIVWAITKNRVLTIENGESEEYLSPNSKLKEGSTELSEESVTIPWEFFGIFVEEIYIGNNVEIKNCKNFFKNFYNLKRINQLPEKIEIAESMFKNCPNLKEVPEVKDSIINANRMFENCSSLKTTNNIQSKLLDAEDFAIFRGCYNIVDDLYQGYNYETFSEYMKIKRKLINQGV